MTELLKTIGEDKERIMIKHLKKWRDMEYKLDTAGESIKTIEAYMTSYPATLGSTPVQGGSSKREDCLINAIDEKTLIEEGVRAAREYFAELLPAWRRLTDDERFMLTVRYIDDDHQGIQHIMSRYHVEKTEAYNRSNAALNRLASIFIF